MLDVHLLALAERQRALLDLVARALHGDREVVERQPLGALEVEVACRSRSSSSCSIARAVGGEPARDARVDPHAGRPRAVVAASTQVAQPALDLDRDRLLGLDDALAVAGRARSWS